jgi:Right handed beta helix region
MPRLLSLLLLLAVSLSGVAQNPPLLNTAFDGDRLTGPGETATFISVLQVPEPSATGLRIVYSIEGDATIERLEKHDGWTCTIAGKTAECTLPSAEAGARWMDVIVRAGSTNGGTATITMTATAAPPVGPRSATATLQTYLVIPVETNADAGPGSLRDAINIANADGRPAKIEFRLPPPVPAEGWFTLIPESPLPPITAHRVVVDGKAQTRFTGDTNPKGPEVAIDGRLAHEGLEIHSTCLARVEGLTLGHFDRRHALWFAATDRCPIGYGYLTDVRVVSENYIGTDPTGMVAWPNFRGVRGDFGNGVIRNNLISGNTLSGIWIWATGGSHATFTIEENRFGVASDGVTPLPNGTTAMLFGDRASGDVRKNLIANHPGMGIAAVRGDTYVRVYENSMRDNGGIAIDWGIDGASRVDDEDALTEPNAPVLLSATYDAVANQTFFNVTTRTTYSPNAYSLRLDFYANRGPDGDGEEWLGTDYPRKTDGGAYQTALPGDHRGKWINATLTRIPVFYARTPLQPRAEAPGIYDETTSEFSNTILIGQ